MTSDELESIFRTADALLAHEKYSGYDSDGCIQCGGRQCFVQCYSEGHNVCSLCGSVQPESIFDYGNGYFTKVLSNYKRIHHFHERISQLLLMESPIPDADWADIHAAIRDSNFCELNKTNIRKVLRSMNKQVYIEKWLQIMYRYTGVRPPSPGINLLHKLDCMFLALQTPFRNHKTAGRRNFLNYNFVFYRMFQQLGVPQYCMFFPMIKSKTKLLQLDNMWRDICKELKWPFTPLKHVQPFAIKLDVSAS